MCKEKNDKELAYNNDGESMRKLYGYVDIIIEKTKLYWNSPIFKILASLGLAIFSWGIEGLWYAYKLGQISAYGIDVSYIDMSQRSIIFQIITIFVIAAALIFANWIVYNLIIGLWEKGIYQLFVLLLVFLAEMVVLFMWIVSYIGLEWTDYIRTFCDVLDINIATCFMVNCGGLVFGIFDLIEKRKKTKFEVPEESEQEDVARSEQIDKNKRAWYWIIVAIMIIYVVEYGYIYYQGRRTEMERDDYKIVYVEEKYDSNNPYLFKDKKHKKAYSVYPVIWEDDKNYILARLYEEGGKKVHFDRLYQWVVKKEDVRVYGKTNIYEITPSKICEDMLHAKSN